MANEEADLTLASFLIDLAIDSKVRRRFAINRKRTLDAVHPPLDDVAKKLLLARRKGRILELLAINHQSCASSIPNGTAARAKTSSARKTASSGKRR